MTTIMGTVTGLPNPGSYGMAIYTGTDMTVGCDGVGSIFWPEEPEVLLDDAAAAQSSSTASDFSVVGDIGNIEALTYTYVPKEKFVAPVEPEVCVPVEAGEDGEGGEECPEPAEEPEVEEEPAAVYNPECNYYTPLAGGEAGESCDGQV